MISASSEFLTMVNNGSIPSIKVLLTLADSTTIWIGNDDIWGNSVSFQEATSEDNSFTIGSAIIGSFMFSINNFEGTYTDVDFRGSTVQPYLYYTDETVQIPKGLYYVTSHKTIGNVINVTALDGMKLLDSTDTPITYPTTAQSLVYEICTTNGITLADTTIPHNTFELTEPVLSDGEYYTDRQKLSYVCQCIGCYAKMDEYGRLVVDWYDFLTPVQISATFDGKSLSTDTFQVTGLRFELSTETETTFSLYGTDDVVLSIGANPYINSDNLDTVCSYISANIFDKTFRVGSLPILSNPCLQAGDVLQITDNITGNVYVIPITSTIYTKSVTQTINCAFEESDEADLRPSSEYRIKALAQSANSTAQSAQSAVNELTTEVTRVAAIADNTNQYFWFTSEGSDTGAHITETTQEEFLADPDNGGGNLLARSNGVAVRDGLTELAVFGADGVRVGQETDSNVIQITPNEIQMSDANGVNVFCIDRNGTSETAIITKLVDVTYLHVTSESSDDPNIFYYTLPLTDYVSGGSLEIVFENGITRSDGVSVGTLAKRKLACTIGTAETATYIASPITIKAYYCYISSDVASLKFEVSKSTAQDVRFRVKSITYDGYVMMPSYTIGTRAATDSKFGSYSTAIGEMLTASGDRQTVIGKYNVEDANDTYALIVGNGVSGTPSNALTLDWNGHLETDDGFSTAKYPYVYIKTVTVSYAAGTIGTRGAAVSVGTIDSLCPDGYTIGGHFVYEHTNTSVFQAITSMNKTSVFLLAYRATGNAVTNASVKVGVLFIPTR